MAAPSASRPSRRPSGCVASRIRSVCPPPPTVASIWRLPGAGASIVMTSSASTDRCPSSMSPPPSAIGARAGPGSACSAALDAQPRQVLGERVGILERPAVLLPPGGRPDLRVIAGADDDGLALQAGPFAQGRRDHDPTLTVEVELVRSGEQEA